MMPETKGKDEYNLTFKKFFLKWLKWGTKTFIICSILLLITLFLSTIATAITGKQFSYVEFNDTFDRADSNTVGNGWTEATETNGQAQIAGNALNMNATAGSASVIITHDINSWNVDYIAFNISRFYNSQAYTGITFANGSTFNGYLDFHDSGNIRCYNTTSGVTLLGPTNGTQTHKIELWLNRTRGSFSVYMDDVLLYQNCLYNLTATPVGNVTTIRIAMGSATAHADKFFDLTYGLIGDLVVAPGNFTPVFISQNPADITSTNVVATRLNITYNMSDTNITNTSSIILNYTSSLFNYINGTPYTPQNTRNYDENNSFNYSWLLGDNIVYPGVYVFNETIMENTTHLGSTLNNINHLLKLELLGVNNSKTYNFFEIMANTTGTNTIYYCNSTYTTGNPATNSNCVQFATLNTNTFNHTHSGNNSMHNVFNLPINSSGFLGGIKVTSTSYFLIKGTSTGGTSYYYITNSTNINQTMFSTNNGATYTTLTSEIVDFHIHQFLSTDYFSYNACYTNNTGSRICSTARTDYYDLTPLPPTTPIINTPINGSIYANGIRMLINWTNSTPYIPGISITYNISLLNNDYSFNKSINTSVNASSTTWPVNVTTNGYYYIKVEAKDTNNLTSFSYSDIFYIYDLYLNITAKNNVTNANITNFTITSSSLSYYNATSLTTTSTTTNGSVLIYTSYGLVIPLDIDATSYALSSYNFSSNSSVNTYQFALYPTNSVYIMVVDQITNVLINTNTTSIIIRSETYYNTSNTTNGYASWSDIPIGNYTIELTAPGYSDASYDIVVYNRSTQSITARLLSNTTYSNIGFYIKSDTYQELSGASITVQRQYSGGSWATTNLISTDENGFSYIPLQEGEIYRFIISYTGYETKQFDMATYNALSPYTFLLTLTSSGLYTNYWAGVNYYYYPLGGVLNQSVHNFSISTYNSTLDIAWTALRTPTTLVNVTGSPSGGTASLSVDLSSYTGVYQVNYSFYFYNDVYGGYFVYNIPVNYYVNSLSTTQTSINESLNDFKTDLLNNTDNGGVWVTILATFIILAIMVTLMQISGQPLLGVIGGVVGTMFFAYVGWFNPVYAGISCVLIILILVFNR